MTRGNLAGRLEALERAAEDGRLVFVLARIGEPAEAAMRRSFGATGRPQNARVIVVETGVERADDA